jgi:LDH2 family malate/lactate/ureidoglycolate dehydrogenase
MRPLYGDPAEPYRCSQLFIAIHTGAFPDGAEFAKRVDEQAQRVTGSKRAPGITRVYAPGELAYSTHLANAGTCNLSRQTFDSLIAAGKQAGINIDL